MFIIGSLAASVSFSFIDMILFEGNETGAKVFYMVMTAALYIVLPGMLDLLHVQKSFYICYITNTLGYLPCYPPQTLHVFGPKNTTTIYGWFFSTSVRS